MRAKAIVAVLALGVALLAVPTGADAKPGIYKVPRADLATVFLHGGQHGFDVFVAVYDGVAVVSAQRTDDEGSLSSVSYTRRVPGATDGDIHFGLGAAGEVDVHLEVEHVREQAKILKGCTGGPAVTEDGHFVGTISFHPPGDFVDVDVHRAPGIVTRRPPLLCRDRALGKKTGAAGEPTDESVRRLIAGTRDGSRRLEVVDYPTFTGEEQTQPLFTASAVRQAGPVTIEDRVSAPSAPDTATFAVPDLEALPATVTAEPGAPFSGSATFELPSRRQTILTGDLAVDLPEVGKVPLTGPRIAAGLCRDLSCSRPLPKALRPHVKGGGFFVSSFIVPPRTRRSG